MKNDGQSGADPSRTLSVTQRMAAICKQGIEGARVDGAGVTMIARDGTRLPVCSTDDLSTLVEELQVTLGQGPCVDATATHAPILVGDLADPLEGVQQRWPIFQDEALRAGVRGVFAFPLGAGSSSLGTLDLYRRTPGPLDDSQLSHGLSAAEALGSTLLAQDSLGLAQEHMGTQMTVHRAAGMVMVQAGISVEEALVLLRATAYAEGTTVNKLAADVEEGRRRFSKERP